MLGSRVWGSWEAAVRAVMEGIMCGSKVPAALGIGGSHCNMRFTRLALEFDVAFGHTVPSYLFEALDVEMLRC